MKTSNVVAGFVAVNVALFSSLAMADEPSTSPGASWAGGTTTTTSSPTPTAAPAPAANRAAAPSSDDADTGADHDRFVGHFAVGYMGASDLPLPAGTTATGLTAGTVSAPTVGVRYWLNKRIGIDGGLGIGYSGGSSELVAGSTTTTTDSAGRLGVLLHGGVPIALVRGKHYTFEVIPELNIGFASSTLKGTGNNADTSLSGFRFELGGRAGAEIHFGFIGLPELSLQGTVGLNLGIQSQKASANGNSASASSSGFGTTVQADPWALFTKNISALYYF